MGITTVTLQIKNAFSPSLSVKENFLVDSGAHFTVLPAEIVKKLKLKPSYKQDFVLVDGKVVKRSIGSALINFEGWELSVPVVLGKKKTTHC
jgi:predicted aspartyl protease